MSGGVVVGINPTAVRTSDEGPEFAPGTIGVVVAPASGTSTSATRKVYKYVQYESGAGAVAAVAGRMASYYAPGGVSTGQDTVVTMDGSDSVAVGAGILQAVIEDGGYGWVQIRGVATMSVALTAGADGNALTRVGAGADDGSLDVSALVSDAICAIALDAGGAAPIVSLCCPE